MQYKSAEPTCLPLLTYFTTSCFLCSMLCGSEELSGVQAEAERSELQVLSNQQQIPGQPLQRLHHQQGDTCAHRNSHLCLFFLHKTLDFKHELQVTHQYFCLPFLAGSRQTSARCRHQSAKSCCFQRCGKCVCIFICSRYVCKNIFRCVY